MASPFVVP